MADFQNFTDVRQLYLADRGSYLYGSAENCSGRVAE